MGIQVIDLPVCKKHPKYKGTRQGKIMCNFCDAIFTLNHQKGACACEYDIRAECDRPAPQKAE